jgi:hypothetical protein
MTKDQLMDYTARLLLAIDDTGGYLYGSTDLEYGKANGLDMAIKILDEVLNGPNSGTK